MKDNLILIGGGGHCRVVIDALTKNNKFNIKGIIDPKLKKGSKILRVPVIGNDSSLTSLFKNGIKNAFIAVGSIGDCSLRIKLYKKLKKIGYRLPVISHPSAIISQRTLIDEGTFIAAGTVINVGCKIGKNVIINTSSSIDHDCSIGDFVHIAPAVAICGQVKIGPESHIGVGAVIIQGINISARSFISAGSIVKKNE